MKLKTFLELARRRATAWRFICCGCRRKMLWRWRCDSRRQGDIRECTVCGNITDTDPCLYCTGAKPQQADDLRGGRSAQHHAIEKTRMYSGMYHVLGGSWHRCKGAAGPTQNQTVDRAPEGRHCRRIIIATNPTAEGEATAMYLSKLLKRWVCGLLGLAWESRWARTWQYADELR